MLDKNLFQPIFQDAINSNVFSKAVAGFLLPSGEKVTLAFNTAESSVFDIASLTKVCPTSTIALKFILEGKISLDDRVTDYIPEFNTNYREEVLVRHLLTHSLDYRVPMKTLIQLPPQGILDNLFNYQFSARPGTIFNYGNPASILLGLILQKVSGKNLQELGEEILFKPLEMTRSGYDPLLRVKKSEIVATEFCKWRNREIQGEIHDESAFVLRELFPVGSAGMFSCVPDLLKFVQALLGDGVFDGTRILPAGILKMISENALDGIAGHSNVPGECTALGFELNSAKFMGTKHSAHTFGKTGFTGASIVADAEKKAAVILLSNFTYPHREANADRIHAFRAKLADTFFDNL